VESSKVIRIADRLTTFLGVPRSRSEVLPPVLHPSIWWWQEPLYFHYLLDLRSVLYIVITKREAS